MENHPLSSIPFSYAHLLRRLEGPSYISADHEAVIFCNRRVTYGELYDRAARLADALVRDGLRKGDRVAVLMRNDPAWFDVFYAVSAVGGVLVSVNYLLRAGEVRFILTDSGATTLVVGDDLANLAKDALGGAPECQRVIVVANAGGRVGPGVKALSGGRDFEAFKANGETAFPDVNIAPADPAVLQYTSGTTGFPKGATHTVSSLLWNSFHQLVDFGVNEQIRYLCVPALCWIAGLHDITLATHWAGGTVILNPSSGFTIEALLQTLDAERCTGTLLVPTILKQFVESPILHQYNLSNLAFVLSGGEPVPVHVIERFNEVLPGTDLIQVYGLSEGPSMAIYLRAEDALRKAGACGKPTTNCELRVADEMDDPVPVGETGEILLRSAATMVGYWNQPDATAETLRGGWLHTGDLGVLDEEGYLTINGRKKDMYISGGLNVYPAEIESVLSRHDDVAECAVFGVPDDRWGEVGMAVIVPRTGASVALDDLRAMCEEALAKYKMPRHFEITTTPLLRTASGKVKTFAIRGEFLKQL